MNISRNDHDTPSSRDDSVSREALQWMVRRLDSAAWTPDDEAAFQRWLEADPAHKQAFALHDAVVARMDGRELWNPSDLHRAAHLARVRPRPRSGLRHRLIVGLGLAAAACAVAFLLISVPPSRPWTREIATARAERIEVPLPDGTTVHLDAQGRLRCTFDDTLRKVELLSGRATFQVAKDASRPFEVVAGDRLVRVVGTFFEVQLILPPGPSAASAYEQIRVAVVEGVVELASRDRSPGVPVRLPAGRQAVWTHGQAAPLSLPLRSGTFAAWREGRLRYEDETLSTVLSDLRRSFPGRIELAEPSLGRLRVSGTFPADDVAAACNLLQSVLPLSIRRPSPDLIVIEGTPPERP